MTHQPANRPRMAATYASGTVRARRWHGDGDVRGYRPPRGWTARADLTDLHPSRAAPCRAPCGGSSKPRNNEPHRPQAVPPWGRWSKTPGAAVAAPGFTQKNAPSPPSVGGDGATHKGARARNPRSQQVWRRIAPPTIRPSPAAMGGAGVATPRLAAAGCTKACRPRRWRFVVCTSRRTVHRHAAQPRFYGASTPRLSMWP
jgi:hypothetical protein